LGARPGAQGATERAGDLLDEKVEVHRRPVAGVVADDRRPCERGRRWGLPEQEDRCLRARQLDGESPRRRTGVRPTAAA
ncbi:MAG TPA: hypothetical protein VLC06_24590, partial [Polyangia bacterium]|nr:hypothetical protein [Polyangia bacterium]